MSRHTIREKAVDAYVPKDNLSAQEVLERDGLNYHVVRRSVYLDDGTPVDGIYALTNDRTNEVYGTCTDRYRPVQNIDVAEVVDSLGCTATNVVQMGSRNGRLMLVGEMDNFEVVEGDTVRMFLNFMWGHDGKSSVSAFTSSVRPFCQNMGPALIAKANQEGQAVSFKHAGNVGAKMDAIRDIMSMYRTQRQQFAAQATYLVGTSLDTDGLDMYYNTTYNRLFGKPETPEEKTRRINLTSMWNSTAEYEKEAFNTDMNMWLAFNSVSKNLMRMVNLRGRTPSPAAKIQSMLQGKDSNRVTIAFETALEMA